MGHGFDRGSSGKRGQESNWRGRSFVPSPVLQLLPFNAQRPGPEGRQLGRAILSFPSLLLLLLHRQAVGKPSEAALRPEEGRGKVLMALQPRAHPGHSHRCSVLKGGGSQGRQWHQPWGWAVEEQQHVWFAQQARTSTV